MLQKFEHIRSRQCIDQRLMEKYDDVLQKFVEEVNEVGVIFETNRHSPPIAINFPKTAGAIQWARTLFKRIKVGFVCSDVTCGGNGLLSSPGCLVKVPVVCSAVFCG